MKYDMTKPCNLCPFRNDEKRLYVDADQLRHLSPGENKDMSVITKDDLLNGTADVASNFDLSPTKTF